MRHWLGFWAALAAFVAATGYSVVQAMQVFGMITFPLDAILIFGFSICIATPFVIAMAAFHHVVSFEKRAWTLAAVVLAAMYATLVSMVYMTELTVTIPQTLQGHAGDVRFISLAPHSFFWAIDALGYVFMSVSTLLAAGALAWRGLEGWLKLFLILHGLQAPVIVMILLRPELLLWGSEWIITGPGSMLLMAVYFARARAPSRR